MMIDGVSSKVHNSGWDVCSMGDPVTCGCGCQTRKCDTSTTHACFQARL